MAVPLCKYFTKCGGCSAQHIDYSLQLENKKKVVQRLLNFDKIEVFSDSEYYYRNRMDLIFHSGGIGFREKNSWHRIVDIEKCVISYDTLNSLIKEIRDYFKNPDYFDLHKKTGTLRYAVIRTPGKNSSVSFVLNNSSAKISEAVEKIKEFSKITSAGNVIVAYVAPDTDSSISNDYFTVKGNNFLEEEFMGITFKFPVQGFFQNNSKMAEKMHSHVNSIVKKYKTENSQLLDLYSGVGTFGIINSSYFKETLLVESFKESIDFAKLNIENSSAKNVKAIVQDDKNLKKIDVSDKLFVITDPPRTGMHPNAISYLKSASPDVIIYISCNVEQLKKDILKFSSYEIKSAAVFDLFPQTPHIEAVAELVKKSF